MAEPPPQFERIMFYPAPKSINAVSKLIPEGVYTTFRTFNGKKVLLLEEHIRRLEESAALVDFPLTINRIELRSALRQAIDDYPYNESRIRVTVDLEKMPGTIYIALEPLHVPSANDYQFGVCAVTRQLRRDRPRAKQTRFISVAESVRDQIPPKANEVLLLDESGHILEGSTSNFFVIIEGKIWTSDENVLYGITRSIVLKAAEIEAIPVQMKTISIKAIGDAQEAFITSSSRSILPIRQIDNTVIGEGKPGPITKTLIKRYWQEIETRLEEL